MWSVTRSVTWSVCGRYVVGKAVGMRLVTRSSERDDVVGFEVAGVWSVNQIDLFTIILEFYIKTTPRQYVYDVTSTGQRLSPWPCNSVKVERKLQSSLCTTYVATNLCSMKTALNSSFCAVTADQKSRRPGGKNAASPTTLDNKQRKGLDVCCTYM